MILPFWLRRLVQLTKAEYFADFFITPPITLAFAALSISRGFSVAWIAMFLAGVAAWTLYEYVLHRFGLHQLPVLRDIHALHHLNQKDHIGVHPAVTAAIYAAFWLLFGIHSSALMVGFSTGYIGYAALHTACHYSAAGQLGAAKRRHVAHHRYHNVNYGVTTSFWDRLFGTEYKPNTTNVSTIGAFQ
jgi:sterol desaturase/sphingolipid hydroxylase (fatty acid hydroxylase superfamily)